VSTSRQPNWFHTNTLHVDFREVQAVEVPAESACVMLHMKGGATLTVYGPWREEMLNSWNKWLAQQVVPS